MRAARDAVVGRIGDLSLVPLADPGSALAIPSDGLRAAADRVKMQMRAHNFAKRQELHNQAAAVVDWQEGRGAELCDELTQLLPGFDRESTAMCCLPGTASLTWCRLNFRADKLIPKVLALPRTEPVQKALDAVKALWMKRHQQQKHGCATPLADGPRKKPMQKPSCLTAKYCLCNERGDGIWGLHCKVMTQVRALLRPGAIRPDVQQGNVVLCLSGLNAEQMDALGDDEEDVDLESFAPDLLCGHGLAHISLLYERPVRPTVRQSQPQVFCRISILRTCQICCAVECSANEERPGCARVLPCR